MNTSDLKNTKERSDDRGKQGLGGISLKIRISFMLGKSVFSPRIALAI